MGLFNWGKNTGETIGGSIKGTLEGAGTFARDMRAAITGQIDPERAAELQAQAMDLEAAAAQAQADINQQEAAHPSLFVAGWRPFIGWTGGLALFYHFVLRPMLVGFTDLDMPPIDAAALWPIITTMLGFGAYRTYEKQTGTQDRH